MLVTLAGATWGYETVSQKLRYFTGIRLSHNTIRKITMEAGKPYAKGVVEFLVDGTMVLRSGGVGLNCILTYLRRRLPSEKWDKHLRGTYPYFPKRRFQIRHPERLTAGLSIGSGPEEAACKQVVGRRLKLSGSCWHIRNLNRVLGTLTLLHSIDLWKNYPQQKNNTTPNG